VFGKSIFRWTATRLMPMQEHSINGARVQSSVKVPERDEPFAASETNPNSRPAVPIPAFLSARGCLVCLSLARQNIRVDSTGAGPGRLGRSVESRNRDDSESN
jgi:hypothetical protein